MKYEDTFDDVDPEIKTSEDGELHHQGGYERAIELRQNIDEIAWHYKTLENLSCIALFLLNLSSTKARLFGRVIVKHTSTQNRNCQI